MQKSYFLSQPHQPFFILGVFNAITAMTLFALSYKGVLSLALDMRTLHSYTLIYLVFTNFFTGFLFTTFPRFNQTEVIAHRYYTILFYTLSLGSLLFYISLFFSLKLSAAAMVFLFIGNFFIVKKLYEIYTISQSGDKTDSFWILSAAIIGLFSHLLFIISLFFPALIEIAIAISFYLYLIFLAFSVGQRMIPFFSHSFAQKDKRFIKLVFISFVLKSLFNATQFIYGEIIVDLFLALYMTKEFLRWELHPFQSPSILWVLHLALAWLPLAFLLSALSLIAELFLDTSFYFLNIHLLSLGFLTTVLIGFGTRVTLGHSGQPPHGDDFATKIFLFIQFIVLARALVSFDAAFGWGIGFVFDISITLWIVLFALWGGRYFKTLVFGTHS